MHMVEILKVKLQNDCEQWLDTMNKSYYKSKNVDFSIIWNDLFTRNIIHIVFGEDISAQKIQMLDLVDRSTSKPMVETTMTFGESIAHTFKILGMTVSMKASNIFYRAILNLTGVSVEFTRFER